MKNQAIDRSAVSHIFNNHWVLLCGAFTVAFGLLTGSGFAHSIGAPSDPSVSISVITPSPKSVSTTVATNATGGCTLRGGTVRVVLVQGNYGYYCGDANLVAKGTGPQTQVVTVSIPLPGMFSRTTGAFYVQRYVTANFSDGATVVQSNLDITGKTCAPLVSGNLGIYAKPPKTTKHHKSK